MGRQIELPYILLRGSPTTKRLESLLYTVGNYSKLRMC